MQLTIMNLKMGIRKMKRIGERHVQAAGDHFKIGDLMCPDGINSVRVASHPLAHSPQ